MIIKFNEYITENIRDKMTPVSDEYIKSKIKEILTGDNGIELIENYYEYFYGDGEGGSDEDYTFYEYINEFVVLLELDKIKEIVINLISEKLPSKLDDIKKLNNINKKYNYFDELDIILDEQDDYMFFELMEDLVKNYDFNSIKELVLDNIKRKTKI